jgi:hypothetical protein
MVLTVRAAVALRIGAEQVRRVTNWPAAMVRLEIKQRDRTVRYPLLYGNQRPVHPYGLGPN